MTTVDSKENQAEMSNVPVVKNAPIKDQVSTQEEGVPEVQNVDSILVQDEAPEEGEAEGADDEDADQPEIVSLEEANELFASGTQALALSNFEEAAEKLSIAVEAQVQHYGQYAIEVAPTFFLYGKALLAAAVQKNGVLGEKADQVKPLSAEPLSANTATIGTIEDSKFVFEGDDDEDDLENDEGKVLDDIEIPLADDLELAWENLDLARLIYIQQEGNEYAMQLAEVHLALGDVSLESENFDQAIKDYEVALTLKVDHAPANRYRELAEAHFKLGLAFEYSEQNEEAIEQISCAMAVLQKRLDSLEVSVGGKGKQIVANDLVEDGDEEMKMLKGFLTELASKRNDLQALIEKEDEGEPLVPVIGTAKAPDAAAVNDISCLVKKRKVAEEQPSPVEDAEKKAKLN